MATRKLFGGIEVNGGAAGRMIIACCCGQCWRVLAHLEPVGRREIAVWLSMRCPGVEPEPEPVPPLSTGWASAPGDPVEDLNRLANELRPKRSRFRVVPPA